MHTTTWDIGNGYSVRWNGSSTFNLLKEGEDVLCFTIYGRFPTINHAKAEASDYLFTHVFERPDSSG